MAKSKKADVRYLVTDLDRTMIFSKKFYKDDLELVPVEYKNGEVISYMTRDALSVVERKLEYIIPATTRSLHEFQRVTPFQKAAWAIVGNGSIILHNGEVVEEWNDKIQSIKQRLKTDYQQLINWMEGLSHLQEGVEPKMVEGFIFAKVKPEEKVTIVSVLEDKLKDFPDWQFVIQKQKLYLLPKEVSKEAAVSYVKNKIPGKFHFAGDGKLDVGMLELSNNLYDSCAFIPMNSDALMLANVRHKLLVDSGPEGAERTLRTVFKMEDNTDVVLSTYGSREKTDPLHITPRTENATLRALCCFDSRLTSLHFSRKLYPEIGWDKFVAYLEASGMKTFRTKSRGFGRQAEVELSKVIAHKKGLLQEALA